MECQIDRYLKAINNLNLNVNNKVPALKKPLLLLLIISKFEEGYFTHNKILYQDIESDLTELIINYGLRPIRRDSKAYQPFQYMDSTLWTLNLPKGVQMSRSKDFNLGVFRDTDTFATLEEGFFLLLKESRKARGVISSFILQKWWPETIQEELRILLNLPLVTFIVEEKQRNRSREFSNNVLANFRYKCAFCGYSASFNKQPFGLDGAHIKWFSQNGPDTIENGLSLCKFHHWAFDRGVLSVAPKKLEIIVSSKFVGQDSKSIEIVEKLIGKQILPFKDIEPSKIYLEWHNDYIFIG